jgi:hypothetical protein
MPCALATILATAAGGGTVSLRTVEAASSRVLPLAGLIYLLEEYQDSQHP